VKVRELECREQIDLAAESAKRSWWFNTGWDWLQHEIWEAQSEAQSEGSSELLLDTIPIIEVRQRLIHRGFTCKIVGSHCRVIL